VAGYLALLSSEARERIREWEHPNPSVNDEPDTRTLAAAGRRVGFASVVIALFLPLFIPGLHMTRLFGGGQPGIGGSGGGHAGVGRDVSEDSAVMKSVYDASTHEGTWIITGKGDPAMVALAHAQGFDAHPTKLSDSEFDAEVASGGHTVIYRGTRPPDDMIQFGQQPAPGSPDSPAGMHEQFRSGSYRPGFGMFGNGFYMAPSHEKAASFSDGSPGSVGRFALHHDAKVVDYEYLLDQFGSVYKGPKWKAASTETKDVISDFGRFAMAKGYDAIRVSAGGKIASGGTVQNEEYVILNRGALLAAETDGQS